MKKGISIWSFAETDLDKVFALAKDAGFEGVELAIDVEGPVNLQSTKEDMEEIKKLADKHGIQLYSVASGLYWKWNYTSDKEEIRNKAKEITKKQLELAHYLGCESILVVPGAVAVDFEPGSEIIDYDVAYERCFEALKELAPVADEVINLAYAYVVIVFVYEQVAEVDDDALFLSCEFQGVQLLGKA